MANRRIGKKVEWKNQPLPRPDLSVPPRTLLSRLNGQVFTPKELMSTLQMGVGEGVSK